MILHNQNTNLKTYCFFFPPSNQCDHTIFSNVIEVIITSLRKSPCLLSSASMALSRIPPVVALEKEVKKKIYKYLELTF